jgi:transposase
MIAFGIDVSKGRSTVAAVDEGRKLIQKPFDVAHNKTELAQLISVINKFDDESCVVMEHTGVYYMSVAETLCKAGIRVSVVNPVLINQFGNNTLRKVKTDKKDSVKIARYAIENRNELHDYTNSDIIRDNLKSFVRQFNFENKTLTAHKNSFGSLLERVFPGLDNFFPLGGAAKPNGHIKIIDFVLEFWHNDCVALLSENKFIEKYRRFCKKSHYIFNELTAKEIHAVSRENLTTMLKNDTTKLLIQGAAKRVLQLSEAVETIRTQMISLAKQLPEYETVTAIYGVGDTLAAQLIGEIGDVRRFASKHSLPAFAGVDPGKNDSGKYVSKSGKISRSGDAILRKTVFQAVECYLLNSPANEPVYQFLDKKRSEGKNYFVYMTAACNKFLRIYYARVCECLNDSESEEQQNCSLDSESEAINEGSAVTATAPEVRLDLDEGDFSCYNEKHDGIVNGINCSPFPSPSATVDEHEKAALSRLASG